MKIIVCPDSFKGTMTAREACEAMSAGIREICPEAEIISLPVGDGGEGTADAMTASLPDTETIECRTVDALRRPITASYMISGGKTALIESAAASGLTLIPPEERDIMKADTYGTGLLIADAMRRGIRDFIICMGGTATCDGGYGAFEALKEKTGYLPPQTDLEKPLHRFTLLCDVDNPLCGPRGAAAVFGPQKGAGPDQIPVLDRRLRAIAKEYKNLTGTDITSMKHAGAAGGLAGMLMAVFGASPLPGISKVLETIGFDSFLPGADLIVTGEGKADASSLSGKAPYGILQAAKRRGIAVALICGKIDDAEILAHSGFDHVVAATPPNAGSTDDYPGFLREAVRETIRGRLNQTSPKSKS